MLLEVSDSVRPKPATASPQSLGGSGAESGLWQAWRPEPRLSHQGITCLPPGRYLGSGEPPADPGFLEGLFQVAAGRFGLDFERLRFSDRAAEGVFRGHIGFVGGVNLNRQRNDSGALSWPG